MFWSKYCHSAFESLIDSGFILSIPKEVAWLLNALFPSETKSKRRYLLKSPIPKIFQSKEQFVVFPKSKSSHEK